MADSKLSSLTAASALTGTELFYSDDGSADVKVTATQLKTFAVGAGSVSVATGKTLTASNTLTFTGTDSSSVAFGTGGTVVYSGGALGTPSSGTLTNATGLPVGGISATGTPSASTYLRGDGTWQSVSATPGGSSTQVQFNDGGSFGGDSRFTFNKTTNVLELTGSIKLDGASFYANGGFPYIATAVGSTTQFQAAGGVAAAGAGLFGFTSNSTNALTTVDATIKRGGGAGILTLGNASTPTDFDRLQFGGTTSSFPALKRSTTTLQVRLADDSAFAPVSSSSVVLNGSSSGAVTVQGAAAAGTWTLTLPTSAGTNGYVLSTNGSGVTSWVAQSGGGSGSPGGSDTQIQFNNSSAFGGSSSLTWNDTTKLLTVTGLGTGGGANTGGLTISGGAMTLSGNISANAWTTSGIRYKSVAATLTDLTSSGTVAAAYTNVYGGNTIAASSATTFTDYFTTFITQPTAGTNVTFTNRWALGLSGNLNVAGRGVFAGGTVTTSQPVLDLTQTWNAAGTAFTGLNLAVTGTALASGSYIASLTNTSVSANAGGLYIRTGGPDNNQLVIDVQSGSRYSGLVVRNNGSTKGQIYWDNTSSFFGLTSSGGPTGIGQGGDILVVDANTARVASNSSYCFTNTAIGSSGARTGTADTFLSRGGAAATLQLGAADAAAPVAQTLQVQGVVAGTSNTAGANFTINGSRGTGTGAGGSIIFQVAPAGSSGTSQNALATALTIDSTKLVTCSGNAQVNGGTLYFETNGNSQIIMGNSLVNSGYGLIVYSNGYKLTYGADSESLRVRSGGAFGWSSSATDARVAPDLFLYRDAANTLALRNSTNAQTLRSYRSYTDASNYSRLALAWNTTTALVMAEGAGTGVDGSVAFNDAALATDATRGFVMIPSCAGTPTGTPADIPTGQIPMVWDSTNLKLYVYTGGAWKASAAFT